MNSLDFINSIPYRISYESFSKNELEIIKFLCLNEGFDLLLIGASVHKVYEKLSFRSHNSCLLTWISCRINDPKRNVSLHHVLMRRKII